MALAGGGLGFVSLVAPPVMQSAGPATPQLQMPQPIVAAPSAEELALNTGSDAAPGLTAPAPVAPAQVDEPALEVDTTPATPPNTAEAADEMTAPADVAEPQVGDGNDTPVTTAVVTPLPAPEADEPEAVDVGSAAPAPEAALAEETADAPVTEVAVDAAAGADDAEPMADEVAADEGAEAEMSDDMAADTDMAEENETPADPAPAGVIVIAPEETETPSDTPLVSTTEPEAAAAPLIVQAPVAGEESTASDEEGTVADVVVEDAEPETPAEDTAEAPEATVAESEPAPATPASEIRINRPGAEESDPAGEEAVVVSPDAEAEELPALEAFASVFENPDDLPLLSVILVDDGSNPAAPTAIGDLGFTPTVALNVLSDDAADRMASYRAAGIEVALQTGLPAGARPADLEVAFEAAFEILPEAAMLFSGGGSVLQSDRSLAAQAMQVLAAQGRGFVAVQRGLGSVTREAEEAGVPAAAVTREIDATGKDQRAIIRDLDQAAFRARQSGGAVLLGQATPETLAALRDWAAELDQAQLLIAPVSAVLLGQQD